MAVAYPWLPLQQLADAAAACHQLALLHKAHNNFTLPAYMTGSPIPRSRMKES